MVFVVILWTIDFLFTIIIIIIKKRHCDSWAFKVIFLEYAPMQSFEQVEFGYAVAVCELGA